MKNKDLISSLQQDVQTAPEPTVIIYHKLFIILYLQKEKEEINWSDASDEEEEKEDINEIEAKNESVVEVKKDTKKKESLRDIFRDKRGKKQVKSRFEKKKVIITIIIILKMTNFLEMKTNITIVIIKS